MTSHQVDHLTPGGRADHLDHVEPVVEVASAGVVRGRYRERAHLVALLSAGYPAVLSIDAAEQDCPDVVFVHTAGGQLSWHIHRDDLELFRHVRRVPPGHPLARWDGHSTGEKHHRLTQLTELTTLLTTARAQALGRGDVALAASASPDVDMAGYVGVGQRIVQLAGIQRLRQPGWRKPVGAVIVDRTSRWGNPFTATAAIAAGEAVNEAEGRAVAVVRHRAWLDGVGPAAQPIGRSGRTVDRRWVLDHLIDLAGRVLCCTCPVDGLPCHRDELRARATHRRSLV